MEGNQESDGAAPPPIRSPQNLLNQMTCFLAWALALLLLPALFLLWLTESPQQRAKRWRKAGHTYKTIASRLNVSATTATEVRPELTTNSKKSPPIGGPYRFALTRIREARRAVR